MPVEKLEFELIIKDDAFNSQIEKVKDTAKKFNTDLSNIMESSLKVNLATEETVAGAKNYNKILKDNARTQDAIRLSTERTNEAIRKAAQMNSSDIQRNAAINREKEAQAAIKTATAQERLNQLQQSGQKTLAANSRLWREVATLATSYFSIMGAERLVSALVRTSAEFELQRVTLGAILQDAAKANELFGQIKELAVISPFTFKELSTYAKQLSAFSVPGRELYDTTKMLADVSAGLGVGMDRLILAYGQIRSASFLRGQEVRQLTEAGVPILEELRKKFAELGEEGLTASDIFDKISKRLVPFQMVASVFQDMTSEGGKFYKMQEVQAETLKGKISNLTDAYQIMFSEIGDKKSGFLKGTVDMLKSFADNYERVGRIILELVAAYGAYKAISKAVLVIDQLIVAQLNAGTAAAARRAASVQVLEKNFKGLAATLKAIKSINPFILLASALAAVGTGLVTAAIQARKFKKELDGIAESKSLEADELAKGYERLVERLRNTTEGTLARRDAISELNKKYGEYLPNLLTEKNALDEIAKAEDKVKNAIYGKAKAYAEEAGYQKITDKYGNTLTNSISAIKDVFVGGGVSAEVAEKLISNLKEVLIKERDKSSAVALREVLASFFIDPKMGQKIADNMGIKDAVAFNKNLDKFADTVRKIADKKSAYDASIAVLFNESSYSSEAEMKSLQSINWLFERREQDIRANMDAEEASIALQDLKIAKLYATKRAYEDLNREAAKAGKEGAWDDKIKQIEQQIAALKPGESSWLQKLVNPLIKEKGNNDLKVQVETNYNDYVDNLRKEYKDILPKVKDIQNTYNKYLADRKAGVVVADEDLKRVKADLDYQRQRKNLIESIGKALGVSIDDKVKTSSGKSQEQIDLEMRRDTIKDIYNWYKKFTEAGMSESIAKTALTNIFPDNKDLIVAGNYVEELLKIADALGKLDPKAAQTLRDDLGVSDAKSIYDAYQAFVKYNDEINKLTDKFGFGGDKISRILVQLTTDDASSEVYFEKMRRSINEIEEYYKKTITGTEEEKNAAWEEWKRNGLITLEELYKAEKEYNRKVAQEKITDLAQGMVKDNYATLFGAGSKALSDWGDKTLAQIAEVISKLKIAQVSAGSLITPGLVQKAADLKINFTDLLAAINQIINADLNNAIDKYVNKAKEMAAATKTIITDLSSILGTIGDTLGDSGVKALSGTLSTISQVADVVLNCDEAVDMIAKNFMKATDEVDKLEEGMLSGAEVAEAMADEGVNIAKSFSIATMVVKIMILLISKIVDLWSDNTKAEEEATKEAIEYKKALLDVNAAAQDGIFGEDLWYNILVRMREYKATFKSLIEDIQKMADYDKNYALFPSQSMWSLDENGNVSISDIMAKYEAGLLEGADAIIENAKQLESAIADIFSQISDDIVNNMVTAFEETGDAMSDFENAFADLGENIAKSLLKSYIIEKILNNYKSKVYDAIGAASNATNTERGMLDFVNTIKTLTEQMRGDFEKAAPFFNELLSIIQDAFGSFTSDEGDTLASGIKGITEDTANLLASYVNAIRADVAATRLSIDGMSVDVKAILGLLPSTPTLAEYLTKIEANTFNTSLTTADILSEMRSMMTNDMGETALRVYM